MATDIDVPFTDESVSGPKDAGYLALGFTLLAVFLMVGLQAGERIINLGADAAGVETDNSDPTIEF